MRGSGNKKNYALSRKRMYVLNKLTLMQLKNEKNNYLNTFSLVVISQVNEIWAQNMKSKKIRDGLVKSKAIMTIMTESINIIATLTDLVC